jgi:aldose 1-epimerase
MAASQTIRIESPNGALALECSPEAGGSITSFRLRRGKENVDLFRAYDPVLPLAPLNAASFPLTPYSNRIINCKLAFEGQEFNVGPRFEPEPHQLHGDGWLQPWQVPQHGAHAVTLALRTERREETPYVYDALQVFTLDDDRMTIGMSVTNRSGIRLPFGLGHHPYFFRNNATVLKTHLPKVWEGKQIVPQRLVATPEKWNFSGGLSMADSQFEPAEHGTRGADLMDHCFQGWNREAEISWPDKGVALVMSADPVFANFVMYIPHRKNFFCAEPVTNIIDGFNLMARGVPDTGSVVLNDGETLSGAMYFTVRACIP